MEIGNKQQNQPSQPIDPQFNQSPVQIIQKSKNSLKSLVLPDRMLEKNKSQQKLLKLTHEEFVGIRSVFEDIIYQLELR
jgi:hypothetical protein